MKELYISWKIKVISTVLVTVLLFVSPTMAGAPSFQGLGFLPEKMDRSFANDVSADGSVVVGHCLVEIYDEDEYWYDIYMEAFRWTEEGGMEGLGYLNYGMQESDAVGVSGDGTVVVGRSGREAVRWVNGSIEGLDFLPGGTHSYSGGISANGSVVVGGGIGTSLGRLAYEAFRWTEDKGMDGLGHLTGSNFFTSTATAASADGSVIVGRSHSTFYEAIRWTEEDGMVGMGFPSFAHGVSADGSVVVGVLYAWSGWDISWNEAFRWTEEGTVGLGFLSATPNNRFESYAWDISADGSMIVGYSSSDRWREACFWDENNAIYSVYDVLVSLGLEDELIGWELWEAKAVSADGLTIVGNGRNPDGKEEAWRAVLGVSVPTLEDTIKTIEDKIDSGEIDDGQAEALISTLDAAGQLLDDGNIVAASNLVDAFIKQVEAMMRSGRLSEEDGQELINAAARARDAFEETG